MKAEIQQQWKLLDLQKLDTRLAQIRYRTANPTQASELDAAKRRADAAAEESVLADTAVSDAEREVRRVESDIAQVQARIKRNTERLNSGSGSAKDLQALQHENGTLERRQAILEESQLEIMERISGLQEKARGFASVLAEAEATVKTLKDEIAAEQRQLESERVSVTNQREQLAPSIQADLLAEYDRIRAESGIGAGALHGRRCLGCGMELDQRTLQTIRNTPMDEVIFCEECGRILVRKSETEA